MSKRTKQKQHSKPADTIEWRVPDVPRSLAADVSGRAKLEGRTVKVLIVEAVREYIERAA